MDRAERRRLVCACVRSAHPSKNATDGAAWSVVARGWASPRFDVLWFNARSYCQGYQEGRPADSDWGLGLVLGMGLGSALAGNLRRCGRDESQNTSFGQASIYVYCSSLVVKPIAIILFRQAHGLETKSRIDGAD